MKNNVQRGPVGDSQNPALCSTFVIYAGSSDFMKFVGSFFGPYYKKIRSRRILQFSEVLFLAHRIFGVYFKNLFQLSTLLQRI